MPSHLILQEAVIVLETFHLVADRPAFTAEEVEQIKEEKRKLQEQHDAICSKTKSLQEANRSVSFAMKRAAVVTAMGLERLTILEAASGLSVNEMVQQTQGMLKALSPLTELSEGLSTVVQNRAETVRGLVNDLEDLEGAGLQKEFRAKLEPFKKAFTDIATMVKGLVAVSDQLMGGKLGEIVKPVLTWAVKRKQKMGSMLETLAAYDAEANKVAGAEGSPVKQGFFGKLMGKKPAGVNTAEQFKRAFEEVVKTKAPGFAKIALSFGADIMERPLKAVVAAFRSFDEGVANSVDLDLIFNMSKQSFGQALKGFLGGLGAGGRVGAGMGGRAPG